MALWFGGSLCWCAQVVNNPFFEKYLAEMRAEFLDHPKPDWIDKVELYTQTQSFNINLHGALYYARTDQC
jgi:hypothetical protein